MLKQIEVSQLRVGMFLSKLCGAWIDTPFWRTSFLLDNQEDIVRIRESGVRQAWIDVSKGLDVEEVAIMVSSSAQPTEPAKPAPVILSQRVKAVGVEDELGRAAILCDKARQEVTSMFQEARMGRTVCAADALPLVDEISQSVMRNADALISLVRLKTKDDYTYMHSVAVCALMISLARELQLDKKTVREAGLAGLLHDIGKMAVPSTILNKPGSLTDDEFITMKSHSEAGHRILTKSGNLEEPVLDVCLHHHEKMDGTGYPHGLAGDGISLLARMGAVCDVYDALTSNRPYKQGWCPSASLGKMAEWRGHFDGRVFQSFVRGLGIYPVGTLVRLTSGRLGVVIEQSKKSLTAPRIKVFFSTKSMTHIVPEMLDLSHPGAREKIVGREEAAKWGIQNFESIRQN